ncbi:transporter substrate-binding domain-containing protein [Thiocystis violacea]|uniref:transporter substrate-binding domain-containing protein n=1 Tax=Thiocystis violacea TaxID=13725 RepID=UPI001906D867|nr:transporter substrate-binding domain-containing protein [Thiocystis violacea]
MDFTDRQDDAMPAFLVKTVIGLLFTLNLAWPWIDSASAAASDDLAPPPHLALTPEERTWLEAHPDIVLGMSDQFPPALIRAADGTLSGFVVDYLELINRRLGTRIRLRVEQSWEAIGRQAVAGKLDGLAVAASNPRWSQSFDLTQPYLYTSYYLFVRRDETLATTDLAALAGKRIGILKGVQSAEQFLKPYPKIRGIAFDSNDELADALLGGRVDLLLANSALEWWRIANAQPFKIGGALPDGRVGISLAIRKDWPELTAILDKALSQISPEEHARIRTLWLGGSPSGDEPKPVLAFTLEERQWIQTHPTFAVAVFPVDPFSVIDGDAVTGYMPELLRAIAAQVGIEPRFVPRTLQETMKQLQQGRIDATTTVIQTPERETFLAFSEETFPLALKTFARTERTDISDLSSLTGKTLASYRGYALSELFKQFLPDNPIVFADDVAGMLRLVAEGKADAAVHELYSGEYALRKNLIGGVVAKGDVQFGDHPRRQAGYYAVRADLPLLKSILDKGQRALPALEKQRIWNQWLPHGEAPSEVTLTPEETRWLTEHPILRYGVDPDWAPIAYLDQDGRASGIGPDYLARIERLLGVRVEAVPIAEWAQGLRRLEQGEIDLLPAIAQTEDRLRRFRFTAPYLTFPVAIFAPVDAPFLGNLEALAGKRVAVVADVAVETWLRQDHPAINLLTYPNLQAALRAVAEHKADAVVDGLVTTSQAIGRSGLIQIRMAGNTPYEMRLGMAVRRDQPLLAGLLDKAIAAIPDPERDSLQSRWIQAPQPARIDYTRLWQVLGVALLILAIVLYWNRRLSIAQAALRQSDTYYRTLIAAMGEGVVVQRQDGQILTCNQAAERILDLTPQRKMKLSTFNPDWQSIHDDGTPFLEETHPVLVTLRTGQPQQGVTMGLRMSNGELRWILLNTQPLLLDGSTHPHAVVVTFSDITARRATEQALRAAQADVQTLIERSPVPMVVSEGLHQRAVLYNRRFSEVIGYSIEEAPDTDHWWPLAYPDPDYRRSLQAEWQRRLAHASLQGESIEPIEARVTCRDGRERIFLVHATSLGQSNLTIFVDLTEQRTAVTQMREAQAQAEQANQAKSDFLANMSHEIRTPMNAILGMLHLCLDTALSTPQRQYLNKAQDASQALLGLLNDILDLSKVEAGQLTLEFTAFALDSVIAHLLAVVEDKAREKGLVCRIAIAPEVPALLVGDPLRLGQVLINLCSNAVKFTQQGDIRVSVRWLETQDARVHLAFSVRDTGIGLTAAQASQLFQPFQQADSSITRRFGGTGLGLSISRQLVEMMDGQIGVESRQGEGSTFHFDAWFGMAPPVTDLIQGDRLARPPSPTRSVVNLIGQRLLVVEDNVLNQEVIRALLERAGAEVEIVNHGAEALEVLEHQGTAAFDAVLMDVQMPEMDGYTATRRLRALPGGALLPVIGLTAHVRREEIERMQAAGMDDQVGKPIDPALLWSVLARHLRLVEEPASARPDAGTAASRPAIPGIDLTAALERLGDQVAILRELLPLFESEYGQAAHTLSALLASGEVEEARQLAHALRGTAGNLGLVEVEQAAEAIESALSDQAPADLEPGLLATLNEALDAARAAIEAALPTFGDVDSGEDGGAPDPEIMMALLTELRTLALGHDPTAEDFWLDHRQAFASGLPTRVYAALSSQIENYGFDTAVETIDHLLTDHGH